MNFSEVLRMVGSCIGLFRAEWLTIFMRAVSLPGDGLVIPVLLTLISAALFYRKDKIFAGILILAPLTGQMLKSVLKNLYQIPRPVEFGCPVLTSVADKYSLPSGHTIFYTIFFGLIAYYCVRHITETRAKIGLLLSILMIALIGYSRVYLGAHWYLDILGGYAVGVSILTVFVLIYGYLLFRRKKSV